MYDIPRYIHICIFIWHSTVLHECEKKRWSTKSATGMLYSRIEDFTVIGISVTF